ncbi:MAG: hypothetical protein JRL30_20360 [Deltaproteobacteria bacterium]|nr:hypothetical protein [Deltaproteobacteria bacterium]
MTTKLKLKNYETLIQTTDIQNGILTIVREHELYNYGIFCDENPTPINDELKLKFGDIIKIKNKVYKLLKISAHVEWDVVIGFHYRDLGFVDQIQCEGFLTVQFGRCDFLTVYTFKESLPARTLEFSESFLNQNSQVLDQAENGEIKIRCEHCNTLRSIRWTDMRLRPNDEAYVQDDYHLCWKCQGLDEEPETYEKKRQRTLFKAREAKRIKKQERLVSEQKKKEYHKVQTHGNG